MLNKSLSMLGLARKARLLEIGEEPVGICCRSGHAKLLLLASDSAEHTIRRAKSYCRTGKPLMMKVPFTKEELGAALGFGNCAICALTDVVFAKSFLETLDSESCDKAILSELSLQSQRTQKRRAEKKAHLKNVKHGKK